MSFLRDLVASNTEAVERVIAERPRAEGKARAQRPRAGIGGDALQVGLAQTPLERSQLSAKRLTGLAHP
jgi:hypothetical protein